MSDFAAARAPRAAMIVGRTLILLLLLSLAHSAGRAQSPQASPTPEPRPKQAAATGTITGRVLGEDGRPVVGATVSFYKSYAPMSGPPRGVSTDAEGRFVTPVLTAGLYTLVAFAPGLVTATDPTADPGEAKYYRTGEVANITLVKGGVITGTVRDANGEPLVAAIVRATRLRDAQGKPTRALGFSTPKMTDDRGVYRIYGLQPGTYIISAGGSMPFYTGANAYESDSPTFYPSSTRDTAAEIPLRSGEEAPGIDIRYRGEQGRTVSGSVVGSVDTGARSALSIILRQSAGGYESSTFVFPGAKPVFSFTGVADGVYEVVAQQGGIGGGEMVASTPRRVTVKGSDVTGIEIALTPLASIAGRITLEPEPKEACGGDGGRAGSLLETMVNARREGKDEDPLRNPFFLAGGGIPTEQGEFSVRNLSAGSYRLVARLPGESWYVRSIVTPGAPAAKGVATPPPVAVKTGERVTGVDILVARDAAGLRGRVAAAAAEGAEATALPANLKVYLVPAERERADDLLRYAEAGVAADGSFAFANLAPGRYLLVARPAPDGGPEGQPARPLAWDADARAKLRKDAEAAATSVELKPCQRTADFALSYPKLR